MKNVVLVNFFLLLSLYAFGQRFLDSASTWYSSSYIDNFVDGDCRLKIDVTKVVGDTMIQNRLCHIIGVFSDGVYIPESEIIVYDSDDKMYFFEDNDWKLIYDFTAKLGDTIQYSISKNFWYYGVFNVPQTYDSLLIVEQSYQLVITHVDTVYSDEGKPLKRYATETLFNLTGHVMDTIIQYVGSKNKLFGSNGYFIPPECLSTFPSLRCYSDSNLTMTFINEECNVLNFTSEITENDITFYPNPGSDAVAFIQPDSMHGNVRFTTYNLQGVKLFYGDVSQTNEIPTAHLNPGIYIFILTDDFGRFWIGKWVKNL
ncbi:MAG: T9SS type A sorting domain-containing protein [Saprospiraceae bacterium]